MPKISIVVPVYNAEKTLDQTIESIRKQTFQDWEVLLIDDCSKDGSATLCEKWAEEDNRFRFLRMPKNSGPSAVRNVGLNHASGDFLAFVDSDDLIVPNYMEIMLEQQQKFGADIIWCNYADVTVGQAPASTNHGLPCGKLFTKQELLNTFLYSTVGLGSTCNKLYRNAFITEHQVSFNEERVRAEDWEFNLMLFNCSPKVYAIPDVLYHYIHQNKQSVMASYRPKDFRMMLRSHELLKQIFGENGFNIDEGALNRDLLNGVIGQMLLFVKSKDGNYQGFLELAKNETVLQAVASNVNVHEMPSFFRIVYAFLKWKMYAPLYFLLRLK